MLSIETHPELYQKGNAQRAVDYAKAIPDKHRKFNIHYYWRGPREFGRKQALCIKAAIANCPQAEITLWLQNYNRQIDLPKCNRLRFQKYDPVELSWGTPVIGDTHLKCSDSKAWNDGDLARLLILYHHGGVYCDCDMVILRDVSPLLDWEWLYQWGSESVWQNGAIMHANKGGQFISDLLVGIRHTKPRKNTTSWGRQLYRRVRKINKHFVVWPCGFFDTSWQNALPCRPFQNVPESGEMYDGCFSWHWHNKWEEPIEEGCKFERVEKMIEAKL